MALRWRWIKQPIIDFVLIQDCWFQAYKLHHSNLPFLSELARHSMGQISSSTLDSFFAGGVAFRTKSNSEFDRLSVLHALLHCKKKCLKESQAQLVAQKSRDIQQGKKQRTANMNHIDGSNTLNESDSSSTSDPSDLPSAEFYILSKHELESNNFPLQGNPECKDYITLPDPKEEKSKVNENAVSLGLTVRWLAQMKG